MVYPSPTTSIFILASNQHQPPTTKQSAVFFSQQINIIHQPGGKWDSKRILW
jgi:hypothetical protein